MVNINISIRKEAYDILTLLKGESKSFSDVIVDELGKKKTALDFFGGLKDVDINWETEKKERKEFRKSFERRLA